MKILNNINKLRQHKIRTNRNLTLKNHNNHRLLNHLIELEILTKTKLNIHKECLHMEYKHQL
jgi:hypothetical protein